MNLQLISKGNQCFMEGTPATRLLGTTEDIVDVIGACFENKAQAVLFYSENLTAGFFDLSTGDAGTILQKLRTYRIKFALVLPLGGLYQSERFREMAAEENKGDDFRTFDDRAEAEAWLFSA